MAMQAFGHICAQAPQPEHFVLSVIFSIYYPINPFKYRLFIFIISKLAAVAAILVKQNINVGLMPKAVNFVMQNSAVLIIKTCEK